MNGSRQQTYYDVYRNRQSWLHHVAYMRLAKVIAIRHALDRQGVNLDAKCVFDYGFGAGTFFRHCPKTAFLQGVELDPVLVDEVTAALRAKKYRHVDLCVIDEADWHEHVLLGRTYDVVVASHVLEHVKDPVDLIKRLLACVNASGHLIAVLPINERVTHDGHEWTVGDAMVRQWAAEAGGNIVDHFEFDCFTQWALPVFESKSPMGRMAAQGLSLFLGLSAAVAGIRLWLSLDRLAVKILRARPGQAVYVLQPTREKT